MVDLNGHEGGNAGDSQAKPEEPSGGRRRSAEGVEGRRQAEGNAVSQSTLRTQSRVGVSTARDCIRQAAKTDCKRSPGSAVFLLARERRFIIRAEGASGVKL